MLVKNNEFYCGSAGNLPCQLARLDQIPAGYVHPSTKQCNYSYTHPSTIQCNASTEINSLKSSVSNGKSAIASAITDKGISTAADATFQTMANNIASIFSGIPYNEQWTSISTASISNTNSRDLKSSTKYLISMYTGDGGWGGYSQVYFIDIINNTCITARYGGYVSYTPQIVILSPEISSEGILIRGRNQSARLNIENRTIRGLYENGSLYYIELS